MSPKKMSSATRVRRLVVGVLVCGGALGAASIDIASSPAAGAARSLPPTARVAAARKVKQVNQTMVMDVSSIQGNTISAHGQEVTGQINGIISFSMTLQNGARAVASFTIFDNGHIGKEHRKGTVRGSGTGSYHVSGAHSYFSGQITSIRGTEEFSHAKSLGVIMTGALNRRTYKFTATLKGKVQE